LHTTCCQADEFAGENAECANGYYFLLPKKSRKPKRQAFDLDTLFAFGPYRSPCEANFIRTSACALGLLDKDASC
jgi:hypothetical protein